MRGIEEKKLQILRESIKESKKNKNVSPWHFGRVHNC